MSTTKVSALAELTTADATDVLLITDVSAAQSKKIQKSNITQENFTTTLKNKLDGIEPAATADQTAQEIATSIDADATAEATLKSALGLGTAAYTASTDYATAAHNHAGVYEPADATILKDADIGVNVQAYNANLVTYATNGNTAYGWGNHASAGYLTSFTETNDLTAAVTWANVPDANITQSSVTQHQAALSITEGQISDLGGDIVLDSDIGVTVQGYDADTAKTDTTQNFTAPQRSADTVDNDGSFDLSAAQNFTCTPTGAITLTFTNIPDGQSGFILLVNTTPQTVALHTNTKGDANLATTLSTAGTYLLSYYADGTNVYVTTSGAIA